MGPNSNFRSEGQTPLARLRQFVRPRAAVETCELCSAVLAPAHEHLVEPTSRQLLCACDACAILFTNQEAKRYRRVPRDVYSLPDFRLTDARWESLMIPIGMAFFFHSTPAGKVVCIYPSPAGPTESLLDLGAWADVVSDNAVLEGLEPDVEALLVNRVAQTRDYYLVPIDECYKLVGLIRANWRGFSGGTEVWQEIARFFDGLKTKAKVKP